MSRKIIHKANTRGRANHGWLDSHHTFSFAGYYSPERMNFGLLRVLNDDIVAPGMGFGAHPHDNMEIISIPLSGELAHQDSTGNKKVIRTNDVQIMSAGSGLTHSEFNNSKTDHVNFLQIWVFPKEQNIKPRYEQKTFNPAERQNKLQTVVSPEKDAESIWINQDAWFTLGTLKSGFTEEYQLHQNGNGVYAFLLEGEVEIDGEKLNKRDGMGISDTQTITIKATSDAELLLMEIPMN
ncbi:pirin family protein [Pontibacter sp. BT310]|uniref:Pirin family protein n=1 Tax=Pontibacter populi TaxID=890055 RepID=A0ABS6XBW3_9BACT|nr:MULTISPECIES: pirin family protein [Pontibacter]MBJ6118631.1 pirin family protein [Pontibacter sp. BT310]MBR0571060.1 pirin family protein [Microvirga sp. STS03]MBW3365485.1 pirin family protein [Pontibacter populi]